MNIHDDEEFNQWQKTERLLFNDQLKDKFNIQYYRHVYAKPEVYFVSEADFLKLKDNQNFDEVLRCLRANYKDDAENK